MFWFWLREGLNQLPAPPPSATPHSWFLPKKGSERRYGGKLVWTRVPHSGGGPMSTCRTAVAESPRAVLPPTPSLQGDVGLGGLGCSHLAPLTPTSRASVPHSRGCCLAFHSRACLEVLTIVTYLSPMPLIVLKVVILIIIIMTVFS